jgi:hypothetical protein
VTEVESASTNKGARGGLGTPAFKK